MLSTILRSGGTWTEKLLYVLISVFCVLLSLTLHEFGHGLAAYAMGDKTAKSSEVRSACFCLGLAGRSLCRLTRTTSGTKRAEWF